MKPEREIIFPPFRLDLATQRLFRDQDAIRLRPKTYAILKYLLEHGDELVTKDRLLDEVWPDVSVGEAVLAGCIRELRRALGDDPTNPRFIETAHRLGYRFIGSIGERSSAESLHTTRPDSGMALPALSESRARAPLVGRERELEKLRKLFARTLEGERQIVFITGEAGIGKTTLIEAFLEELPAGQAIMARGQCVEHYGASEPCLPVLEALSRLCRAPGQERLIALLRSQAPTWLVQMPWLLGPDDRKALESEIIGATRDRMLREFAELVERITASQTLVLALEDLHWSDYSTLDLVSYLARRRDPARLLLLGSYRPMEIALSGHPLERVKQELDAHRRSVELPLAFLSAESIARYLDGRFPLHRLPPDLARMISRRTDGNPLFLVNLVDYLIDRALIVETDEGWRLEARIEQGIERGETGIPEGIRQMIDKQIDRLTQDEQRTLFAASVAGVEFSAASVAAGLAADPIEIEECCERLQRRRHLLRAAGSEQLPDGTESARYAFIHALYQNGLYERIAIARRRQLHLRIGEQREAAFGARAAEIAAELAMHFEKGQDLRRAASYLRLAAENAARRFANRDAVELAGRGLELIARLPDDQARAQEELLLQITRGVPLMATYGYGALEVERTYSRARELCQQLGESLQLFPALLGLWGFDLIRADLRAAESLSMQLLTLSKQAGERAFEVDACWAAGVTAVNRGQFAEAVEYFERGIALYDRREHQAHTLRLGQDPGVSCRCFGAWARWSLGEAESAVRMIDEALALAGELAHPHTLAFAHFFAAFVRHFRREEARALEHAEATIAICREHGFVLFLAFGMILRGWALGRMGREAEAESEIREWLGRYQEAGHAISLPHFRAILAEVFAARGELEAGLKELREALALVERTEERYYEAELLRLEGEMLLKTNGARARARAESSFSRAIEVARRQRARGFELRAAMSLGRLWQQEGRGAEARALLAPIYEAIVEGRETIDMKEAGELIAELRMLEEAERNRIN